MSTMTDFQKVQFLISQLCDIRQGLKRIRNELVDPSMDHMVEREIHMCEYAIAKMHEDGGEKLLNAYDSMFTQVIRKIGIEIDE